MTETNASTLALEAALHDVRNAMNLVVGLAANLRDGIDGPVTPAQHQSAARIVEVAVHAGVILERVRDDARPPAPETIDLVELVGRITTSFAAQALARGLSLRPPEGAPVTLRCDPVEVSRAVYNLIDNALKFTPAGGLVAAFVRRVEVDGGSRVEVEVTDSGPGVPIEDRARVVERGQRLARDAAAPGSGLGLSIAHDIAAKHGGRLEIGAAINGGASVILRLPGDTEDGLHQTIGTRRQAQQ